RIRHKHGWNFEIDSPELTVNSGVKGVKAKLTLRPPKGRSARPGDEVTLDISWQGQTLLVEPLKGRIRAKLAPPPVVRNAIVVGSAVVALVGGLGVWAAGRTRPGPSLPPTASPSVLGTVMDGMGLTPQPTEVRFPGQAVDTRSPGHSVVVTNPGIHSVFIAGTRFVGPNSRYFVPGRDTCSGTR